MPAQSRGLHHTSLHPPPQPPPPQPLPPLQPESPPEWLLHPLPPPPPRLPPQLLHPPPPEPPPLSFLPTRVAAHNRKRMNSTTMTVGKWSLAGTFPTLQATRPTSAKVMPAAAATWATRNLRHQPVAGAVDALVARLAVKAEFTAGPDVGGWVFVKEAAVALLGALIPVCELLRLVLASTGRAMVQGLTQGIAAEVLPSSCGCRPDADARPDPPHLRASLGARRGLPAAGSACIPG